ncbi:hypothetical protein GGR28_000506 [Lewinella aquimaris]|uniref:DUF5723 domain-containing protein n=1 Tax=Neolewinella aquimaris TaxID=1835722 RepID=A0A840E2J8_9BACT|nr:DUF4421 family protein [Neolewinella aquimaris]MBB4077905.1 hypothetical protein [Neolewinella aquimaris]
MSAIPVSAQLDSSFVETFASTTRVNGGLRYRDNSATFSVGNQETLKLGNRGLALRLGGRYKWIGYTFSIPLSDLGTDSELGNAKSLGANIQFYRDKFYLNANLRRTIGFEREAVGEETIFRDDIRFFNALLFGFRILNSKTFSLRSSFKLRNRQLRSAGSLLVAGAIHRQILKADSLIIPLRNNGSTTIDRFSQTKVGVGLGYAHTFVFGKLFFATPLLVVGPEIRFIDYDPIASARELERFRVSPRIRGRLAVGVNGRRNYAALTGAYLPSADASEKLNTRVDEVQIELVLGHRIGIED